MAGLRVFRSLQEAVEAGYEVYDRTRTGYLVRKKTMGGYALALVDGTIGEETGTTWGQPPKR